MEAGSGAVQLVDLDLDELRGLEVLVVDCFIQLVFLDVDLDAKLGDVYLPFLLLFLSGGFSAGGVGWTESGPGVGRIADPGSPSKHKKLFENPTKITYSKK